MAADYRGLRADLEADSSWGTLPNEQLPPGLAPAAKGEYAHLVGAAQPGISMRLWLVVLCSVAVFLGGACSGGNDSDAKEAAARALNAMENASSYHVLVSSASGSPDAASSGVDIDFQAPNRYHTLAREAGVTNEQVWSDLIHFRDCEDGACEDWQTIPRPTASTALAEQIAGFPALPLLALKYVQSADVSDSGEGLRISGAFNFGGALGSEVCAQAEAGSSSEAIKCESSVPSEDSANASFDIWVDTETLFLVRAIIHTTDFGDSSDIRYDYSDYGGVMVSDPD